MKAERYIAQVLIPFVEAVKEGKQPKEFYSGWASAIMDYKGKDMDLTPPTEAG